MMSAPPARLHYTRVMSYDIIIIRNVMSFLVKSVWRNLLRTSPLSKTTLTSRTVSSSVSEVNSLKPVDALMSRLQSAGSAAALFAAVQAHLPNMNHQHLLQALRILFELHKAGKCEQESEDLVKDPAFSVLCQNFKKHARSLEVNEAIEALKVLSYLKVPVDTLIVKTLLQIIRTQINLVNVRQIMFLDFILSRFDSKDYLVDALKLALPLAFQIHLPLELDNEDLPLLKDMLNYSCLHHLPDRCINNVVTGLLLHDQAINGQIAKSIVWSLSKVNCNQNMFPTRTQLLHICYDILTDCMDELTYDDVLRTAARVKIRMLEKHSEYYHEQLMDAIAEYVVRNEVEFEKALLVARMLSRIAHTHLGLIDYLCQLAASSPGTLANARTNILFGFVNCLSNNNFTPEPDQWAEIRKQISLNTVLDGKSYALPWAKFCLELASLGHYEDKLISKVFSKEFLDGYLSRENNTLDYIQLLMLHEAVNAFHSRDYKLPPEVLEKAKSIYPTYPATEQLEGLLARGLGSPEYVVRNVTLPSGIIADTVLCLKGGYPVKLPMLGGDTKPSIEQLNIPQDSVVVCVMNFTHGCFSMNSNRLRGTFRLLLDILEQRGYVAVAVNMSEWLNAPPHERVPYLMREISYKCGEIGMKLSAT